MIRGAVRGYYRGSLLPPKLFEMQLQKRQLLINVGTSLHISGNPTKRPKNEIEIARRYDLASFICWARIASILKRMS
jgi:hypothetical protein